MSEIIKKYIKRDVYTEINSSISQKFVDAGLEKIRACINCGTCSGGCPSGRRTAMRTRSLIRKALIGDKSVLSDIDLWFCSTCYTCYERCPRDIPITDLIIKLRNIAVENGNILESHLNLCEMFMETGHGVPVNAKSHENWRKLRESLDLPDLPPTVHSFPKELEECQELMKLVGLTKIIDKIKKIKNGEIVLP